MFILLNDFEQLDDYGILFEKYQLITKQSLDEKNDYI